MGNCLAQLKRCGADLGHFVEALPDKSWKVSRPEPDETGLRLFVGRWITWITCGELAARVPPTTKTSA